MRESINGAWLIGIIMVFMAVFIAYTSISINYSNAFLMRTKMVTAIEQYQGMNDKSLTANYNIMKSYGYVNTGTCPKDTKCIYKKTKRNGYANCNYCVGREMHQERDASSKGGYAINRYYYRVNVFFDFNLPILGDILKFNVAGESNAITYPYDTIF